MDSMLKRATSINSPLVRGLIAAILLGALAIGYFALRPDRSSGNSPVSVDNAPTAQATAAPDPDTGALDDNPPIVGRPAPDFALRDTSGKLVKLSDFRGKVVWVNFWATWCRPCKQELPDIQQLYDEKNEDGLVVLAVNYQDAPDRAVSYFQDNGLSVPMLLDREGEVYKQYRLQGLPDSFFLDREGNIAALQFGLVTEKKGRERLAAAGLP
jgi:peroxiredoxin